MPLDEEDREFASHLVDFARIVERSRIIRTGMIVFAVTVGIICVTVAAIVLFDQPGWVTVSLALIAALLGPSGLIMYILKSRRKSVKKHHRRVVELEQQIDPGRTSSETSESSGGEAES